MTAETVDFLDADDLLKIAAGVLDEVAVRDAGGVSAAAARPQMTVFGSDAYVTFEEKAAALLHSLVRNHPLVDGNKRLAWSATRVLFLLNGRDLSYDSVDDAEEMVVGAAAGALDVADIGAWLRSSEVDRRV